MDEITPAAPIPKLRDQIFGEEELANELPDCSVRKLRVMRYSGVGPKWFKIGKSVAYRRADVEQWMQENSILIDRQRRSKTRRGR